MKRILQSLPCGVILMAALLAGGCGKSDRAAIRGSVTVDGAPLPEGEIAFIPDASTSSPATGGPIKDGSYSIPAKQGAMGGNFRVEITAVRPTGKKIRGPFGNTTDEFANYLPKRFNFESQLQAQIKPNEKNVIDFELQSK